MCPGKFSFSKENFPVCHGDYGPWQLFMGHGAEMSRFEVSFKGPVCCPVMARFMATARLGVCD